MARQGQSPSQSFLKAAQALQASMQTPEAQGFGTAIEKRPLFSPRFISKSLTGLLWAAASTVPVLLWMSIVSDSAPSLALTMKALQTASPLNLLIAALAALFATMAVMAIVVALLAALSSLHPNIRPASLGRQE